MSNRRVMTPTPPLLQMRAKPLVRDFFRLKKGATALALPEPTTLKAMRERLPILHEAICAMQSLDDLGSEEANRQAHADEEELQRRQRILEERIRRASGE